MNLRTGDGATSEFWRLIRTRHVSRLEASDSLPHPIRSRRSIAILAGILVSALLVLDLRSSWVESRLLSAVDARSTYSLAPGRDRARHYPAAGPYDRRLGYSMLPGLLDRLEARGYKVAAQARTSTIPAILTRLGLFPIYHEKAHAGLQILDRNAKPLYGREYPPWIYPDFDSIPPLAVKTLLFIENRSLLDPAHPRRNPALEWGRLTRAVVDLGVHSVDHAHPAIGGSTLATQLEKMRHSPGGRTGSVGEKIRQVASASLRAYLDGPETLNSQRRIILDYINSIPLAATRATGEVIGIGDGLRVWYGNDFKTVNQLLTADERTLDQEQMARRGRAYREVLSLFLALRSPTFYLVRNQEALSLQIDRYLRALCDSGVITVRLRDVALCDGALLRPRLRPLEKEPVNFAAQKAPDAVRTSLLTKLGIDNLYALDRLDLTVQTTYDSTAQDKVTQLLQGLSDPAKLESAGLHQHQLLDQGDPTSVIYSVTLYERGHGANLLRVQSDNYNQPLDISQGTKLQLGSTAKLRTLINYLEIVSGLYQQYAAMSPQELKSVIVVPGDALTQWAVSYLSTAMDKSLRPMLRAALQRKYSGSPGEAFFTAGGRHVFANFERSEDGQIFTVSQGFQNSVNLVFIRLLRDIERYYMFRVPGASPRVLTDPNSPARHSYLMRFADFEGREFLQRFYDKYHDQTAEQALETLEASARTPLRMAVIYRSVRADAGLDEFSAFLRSHLPAAALAGRNVEDLYAKLGPDKFDLQDRGYLAHVHPLELWQVGYMQNHAKATLAEVFVKSAAERQEVYGWLFKSRYKHAQDERILTVLESDAFKEIHKAWKRLGYPFEALVPSYATAIGVSGDTPAALAELAGILVNGGVRYPSVTIDQLEFAKGTPAQANVTRDTKAGERVLSTEIAALVRSEMVGVVENGTGRRAHGGFHLPDGTTLAVGGKTGTGDNRFEVYGPHGLSVASRVVNRTAAFVFFIGDRYFGSVLAFVPGKTAENYKFTSALAVQIFKDLSPALMSLIKDREPATLGQSLVVGMPLSSIPLDHPRAYE
jgi:membrane peptidoglycan carboxypeptidase